jgi:sarcosine oxidase subunit beta
MSQPYDVAVIGGGIMGCACALRLSDGNMRVVVLEKGDLCSGASGVNAGTLSLQIKRVGLMEYALHGHKIWQDMGDSVGFRKTGGFTLAFNDREAALLQERQTLKRKAGAPIEFVSPKSLLQQEPAVSQNVTLASYCAEDGHANSLLTGQYYRKRLKAAGIAYCEQSPVSAIDRNPVGLIFKTHTTQILAKRNLNAAGAWIEPLGAMLGIHLPVHARVNTVSVTEPIPMVFGSVLGHATGLLTMKQKPNGTVLIGGGWQGYGTPDTGRGCVSAESMLSNVALAQYAVPSLAKARIIRSWTGFEANVPDFYPLAGNLPGVEDAFVLGCVRGGFTIGPYIGKLMGDHILGREPELPLFDPGRSFEGVA